MVNGKVRIFSAQRGEPCSTFSIHLHFGSSASFGLQPNGVHVTVTWDEHIIIDRRRIMRPGSGQTRMSNDCSSDVKVDSKLGRGLLRDYKTSLIIRLTFVWSSTHHQQSAPPPPDVTCVSTMRSWLHSSLQLDPRRWPLEQSHWWEAECFWWIIVIRQAHITQCAPVPHTVMQDNCYWQHYKNWH